MNARTYPFNILYLYIVKRCHVAIYSCLKVWKNGSTIQILEMLNCQLWHLISPFFRCMSGEVVSVCPEVSELLLPVLPPY